MANAILCSNLLTDTDISITPGGTPLTGYPADNLRVFQPGLTMRLATLSSNFNMGWFREFGTVYADTVALIGTNMTPTPNLLIYANDMSESAEWDVTNASVASTAGATTVAGTTSIWRLTESSTGEHYIQQEWVPPTSQNSDFSHQYSDSMTFSIYAKDPRNVRLRVYQGASYAYQNFDLSTGETNGSVASIGLTATSAISIAGPLAGDPADTWYRLSISVSDGLSAVVDGNIICRAQLLDDSFTASYASAGSYADMIAPQLEIASAVSTYAPTEDESGAQWRVQIFDSGGSDWATESLWMPVATRDLTGQFADLGFSNMVYTAPSAVASGSFQVFHRDPTNAAGYVEIGTAVLGEAFRPDINIASGYTIGWTEEGGSSRSPGGQLYRPQNPVSRVLTMAHEYLTEAEALAGAFKLQRQVGRSRGILASVDPDGTYASETTIWGMLDAPAPNTRRAYSTTLGGNVYQTTWDVIEALP